MRAERESAEDMTSEREFHLVCSHSFFFSSPHATLLAPALPTMAEYISELKTFAKDSVRLVKRCNKPDAKGVRPAVEEEKKSRSPNAFRRACPPPHGAPPGAAPPMAAPGPARARHGKASRSITRSEACAGGSARPRPCLAAATLSFRARRPPFPPRLPCAHPPPSPLSAFSPFQSTTRSSPRRPWALWSWAPSASSSNSSSL